MELALNLEWMAMAAAMCWLWVHHARREGHRRWAQIIALGLVFVMMFVVITMYDDMTMAQKPAEIRCFQREDKSGARAHIPVHFVVASIPTDAAGLPFNMSYSAVLGGPLVSHVRISALSCIQNRPPPAD